MFYFLTWKSWSSNEKTLWIRARPLLESNPWYTPTTGGAFTRATGWHKLVSLPEWREKSLWPRWKFHLLKLPGSLKNMVKKLVTLAVLSPEQLVNLHGNFLFQDVEQPGSWLSLQQGIVGSDEIVSLANGWASELEPEWTKAQIVSASWPIGRLGIWMAI